MDGVAELEGSLARELNLQGRAAPEMDLGPFDAPHRGQACDRRGPGGVARVLAGYVEIVRADVDKPLIQKA